MKMTDTRKKIGIALGGGGARGLAHIGVLKVFDEFGIHPDIISGTSIGAIVGALYAGGHKPAEIEHLVLSLNWKKLISLVDMAIPVSGLFHGNRVVSLLKSIIGDLEFNQLRCNFSCVATDIVNGEQVILQDGSLIEAVRASISLPGIFTPVLISGRHLVDGGLVNTVPVSVCRQMGADFVAGVNVIPDPGRVMCTPQRNTQFPVCEIEPDPAKELVLSGSLARSLKSRINDVDKATSKFLIMHRDDKKKPLKKAADKRIKSPRLIDVLSQTLTIAEYRVALENLKDADIAINPNVEEIGFWQFHHAAHAIAAGEKAARSALETYGVSALQN